MTDTVVPSPIVHELLNQYNYEEWSLLVETYLLANGLWEIVEATTDPPKREDGEVEFQAWRKSNAKALHSIQISCGADAISFIRGTRRAKVAWDILAEKLKLAEASQATGIEKISDNDTNSNPTTVDMEPGEGSAIEESSNIGHEDGHVNQTLWYLVENDEWDAAMEFLNNHPEAVTARLSRYNETILHKAVLGRKVDVAKKLVDLMKPEDLEIQTHKGSTALHHVITITPEHVELAKCMVKKNRKLLNIVFPRNNLPPLVRAQYMEEGEKMAQYLYSVTSRETLNDSHCATLIITGFRLKRFDIAWDLIQRYPELAIAESHSKKTPLNQLADIRSAFLSGSSLSFWEQWIYDSIQIKPMPTIDTTDEICINVQKLENDDQSNQQHLISSGTSLFLGLVKTFSKLLGCTFDRIYEMKLVHVRIFEFLPRMCEVIKNKDVKELQDLKTAMFLATKKGHVEYLTHLCRANAKLLTITNEKGRSIFQVAAECRQHKVFSLVNGVGHQETRKWLVNRQDEFGNNMLHMVGTISSVAQINHIQGAALQMQRELQWFKELECISSATALEVVNQTDKMTPHELFTKGHKDLVKEGEREMKDTATTSCAVVGALIVTITFAAAFTVPGGNKQDTGLPIFLSKRAFIIFIVLDVISLFSSTTSVMIFLGILTSRYAECDFLKSLPTKMIFGLSTLFLSIAAMMIAFSSALSIMLGKSSIAILVALLASVPVTSFIWMQFPLLLELVISTYGAGVFDRKIKDWPYEDPKYSALC